MSKRKSIGAANTLFKYFAKSPPPIKKAKLDADLGSSENRSLNGEKHAQSICKSMEITIISHYILGSLNCMHHNVQKMPNYGRNLVNTIPLVWILKHL